MHRLLLTLFIFSFLFSEEESNFDDNSILTNLAGEPSAIVGGCVNVISGDFFDIAQDLFIQGAEPLVLERSYCSSDASDGGLCRGWHVNLQGSIKCFHASEQYILQEAFGSQLAFGKVTGNEAKLSKKMLSKGFTNNASGLISGKTNLKNYAIRISDPVDRHCKVIKGDGSIAIFQRRERSGLYDDKIYRLRLEKKPNGLEKHFHYDQKDRLNFAAIVRNSQPLQTLSFEYPAKEQMHVLSGDGRSVHYLIKNGNLETVERPNAPAVNYMLDSFHKKIVEKRIGAQSLQINYYPPFGHEKTSLGKVQCILAPVGADSTPIAVYRFQYGNRTCSVFNVYGTQTAYVWNKDLRLTAIEKFDSKGNLYVKDQLYWGKDGDAGNLVSRVFCAEVPLFCKTYAYDEAGNVTRESFYGNISGCNSAPLIINKEGRPIETGCERHEKEYIYSQDGRNLLLLETEGSRGKAYRYYDQTDLVAIKYILYHGRIMQRHCYNYDSNCALVSEIIDNGISDDPLDLSHVTYRKLLIMTPRTTFPFGLPDSIEEYYNDAAGKQYFLKALVNTYSLEGHLTRQDCYDANREYRYSLFWEYDAFGNVTKEVNALGQTVLRKYDLHSNLIEEEGLSFKTFFTYDHSNRLIRKDEVHADRTLSTRYSYDLLGNKTAFIDSYGNETNYVYDEFGRLVHIVSPCVLDENDAEVRPIATMGYDSLGNRCLSIDPKGNATRTFYTAKGKPYLIQHPDGTKEEFTYLLHGPLETHTHRNGCALRYTRDYQDRIIRTDFYTPDGILKSTTTAEYDAFHLLSETDAMGNVTEYGYDVFGRKKSVTANGCTETVEYDALGRIVQKTANYGSEAHEVIVKRFWYDPLDRIVQETSEDYFGHVLYQHNYRYDHEGRVICDTTYNQNGPNATETRYDSHGTPFKVIDALGNVTTTRVHFDYRNALNQIVPCMEVTDALGNTTITIKDALNRNVLCVRKNALDSITQQYATSYDRNGNRCKVVEKIIHSGQDVTHLWTYDCMNRIATIVEGFSSPDQRQKAYSYNELGQLQTICKPSGVVLQHIYSSDGHLSHHLASDGSFHYRFDYDLNGNLIGSYDEMLQKATLRKYLHDRLIGETQATGQTIKYTYDFLGRVTSLTLPDCSSINYKYDGQLRQITRLTVCGTELYRHTYDSYDLSGNCLSQSLLKNAGTLSQEYDLKGRLISRATKHTHEKITAYDSCNNMLSRQQGTKNTDYAYDDLYQLKSENGRTYTYDSTYNRIAKDGCSFEFNSLNHICMPGYVYDQDGRLIQTPTAKYSYDALDRLLSVTKDDVTTAYTYDSFNRRLTKNSTIYLYDGEKEIGSVTNGAFTELRILAPGSTEISSAIAIELEDKLYAPVHDFSGNVIALINPDGSPAETYSYTSFGEETSQPSSNPWRFASKRFDPESGLTYFGHRFYDPTLGRWLTPDPLSYACGPNLYAYVLNNPYRYMDPDGRVIIALPLVYLTFGIGEVVLSFITVESLAAAATAIFIAATVKEINTAYDHSLETPSPLIAMEGQTAEQGTSTSETDSNAQNGSKRHTPDQQSLCELVKEIDEMGISNEEADTLLEWGKEYNYPNTRDDRGETHWKGGDHIHVGPGHIRINN